MIRRKIYQQFPSLFSLPVTGQQTQIYAWHLWLLEVRVALRAASAATQDLGFCRLFRRTGPYFLQGDSNPRNNDLQIFKPPLSPLRLADDQYRSENLV
jgi:hypothetical protein